MRKLYFILLFLIPSIFSIAQEDTIIYTIVDELPRFPGCEGLDTTIQVKNQCAQASLLAFLYGNVQYPVEARENGNEGQVVMNFIVEKDGSISNPKILKDIGGGCGNEAVRVLDGMNGALKDVGLAWKPGIKNGKAVRTQVTVPIKFKLEDPPEFVMSGLDSIYVVFDDSLHFNGGWELFANHIDEGLKYPAKFQDSCWIGEMDIQLLVRPNGEVKVLDVVDFGGLGFDFQYEAIAISNATTGKWVPATRNGRNVAATFSYSIVFIPDNEGCKQRVKDYENANILVNEGSQLFNEGNKEAAYEKIGKAIEMFPNNANYLYLRGQAYMADDNMLKACEDLTRVKEIVPIGLVNDILPLICGKAMLEEEGK